jgi:diaminohydroxyphosphoribosylaminopyrimidine deaminase/5-amino-6-(5-phosphoribosylamino)uracil reductase
VLSDQDYMARASFMAARARGRTSPNPMVGAVVVSPEGVVIGSGYHERAGQAHAEIRALDVAGGRAKDATLYCTLEPCSHTGRTPPCVDRIIAAGIARVVASVEDPNPKVSGGGFRKLREHGIAVDVGLGRDEAIRLNCAFRSVMRLGRPYVVAKIALGIDGRIAARPGARTRLSSAPADRRNQRLRAEVDAIAVGSGTVLADDPLLTVREVYRERPLSRVVFDRRLRTGPRARVFETLADGPVYIVTTIADAARRADRVRELEAAGANLLQLPTGDLRAAFRRLAELGLQFVLLEGGALLHDAALREGLVDRVRMIVTPRIAGEAGVPWVSLSRLSASSLIEASVEACGADVIIEGYVHRPD